MAAAEAMAFVVAVLLPLFGFFALVVAAARLRGSRGLVAGAAARDGERKNEKDDDDVDDDESDDTRATTLDRLTRG